MPEKITAFTVIRSLGLRYTILRGLYHGALRSGVVRLLNPTRIKPIPIVDRSVWQQRKTFFFPAGGPAQIPTDAHAGCIKTTEKITQGVFPFFNGIECDISNEPVFLTDPQSGKIYDQNTHWTRVQDFDERLDIKYVWELSRFCYLLHVMRADKHSGKNLGTFAIGEILKWIDQNPYNRGPQYVSGQEIALRLLNWNFILYYYSEHSALNDDALQKIFQSVYEQLLHIEKNLFFTKQFVRNNHLITEAAALFVCGTLYPFLPGAHRFAAKGKKILEKEAEKQIFPDGTYMQHSTNYHRVVVQLFTYVLNIAHIHHISFNRVVSARLQASIGFLNNCMQHKTGQLPNTGNNDGSLFFPLNDAGYTDHRPTLQALGFLLNTDLQFPELYEDMYWFGIAPEGKASVQSEGVYTFPVGGYIIFRDKNSFVYMRAGRNKPRPAQADNLHLEINHNGIPLLTDGGTYSYKSNTKYGNYFFGSAAHNTVLLEGQDQMVKAGRFLWVGKSECFFLEGSSNTSEVKLEGHIHAFTQLGKNVRHKRVVRRETGSTFWEITDQFEHANGLKKQQNWICTDAFHALAEIEAFDEQMQSIPADIQEGYISETYGVVKNTERRIFTTKTNRITTIIRLKQ